MPDWQRARSASPPSRAVLLAGAGAALVVLGAALAATVPEDDELAVDETDRAEPLEPDEPDEPDEPADDADDAAPRARDEVTVGSWERLPDVPLEAERVDVAAATDGRERLPEHLPDPGGPTGDPEDAPEAREEQDPDDDAPAEDERPDQGVAIHVATSAATGEHGGLRTEVATLRLGQPISAVDDPMADPSTDPTDPSDPSTGPTDDADDDLTTHPDTDVPDPTPDPGPSSSWERQPTPPVRDGRVSLAAGVGGHLVLLAGGQSIPPAMASLDPVDPEWETVSPPQLGGSRMGDAGQLGLLLVRGRSDDPAEVQHFNAYAREWSLLDDAPVRARPGGAVETAGVIAAIGPPVDDTDEADEADAAEDPDAPLAAAVHDGRAWTDADPAPADPGWQPTWAVHRGDGVVALGPVEDAEASPTHQALQWHPASGWHELDWPEPPVTLRPDDFALEVLGDAVLLRTDDDLQRAWMLPDAIDPAGFDPDAADDPDDAQRWLPLTPPPSELGSDPELVIAGGRLVALGGTDPDGEPSTAAFALDPTVTP